MALDVETYKPMLKQKYAAKKKKKVVKEILKKLRK
jgi:hypothetical protein